MAFAGYATSDDLKTWLALPEAPANSDPLLRSATFLVALACQRNPFADPPEGSDVEPLKDATLAQAASWVTLNIDPTTLGVNPTGAPVKKSSIIGGDVERDTSKQADAQLAAARELCPESLAILTATGLIWQPSPLGADDTDPLPQWGQAVWRRPWQQSLSGEWERPVSPDWPFV